MVILFVIFVTNGIPGQTVKAKVMKKKKRFAEARKIEVITPSADEIKVPFQPISGAPYITLPISKQQEYKKLTALDLFRKIGEIDNTEELFDEYIESPEVYNYRNKMEYSFSVIRHDINTNEEHDDFGLGFKHTGTWWKVENLDKDSGLFDKQMEDSLKDIRIYLEQTGLPAWHPPKKEGFYRHLVVRKSFSNDELLLNLVTSSTDSEKFDKNAFAAFLKELIR